MRFNSTIMTAVGGKVGNVVGMMNKAGMCVRSWVVPANPNTSAQQGVRGTLSTLATAWSDTLTQAQRDGWDAYAATLTYTSKLGTDYAISGFGAYVAANGARIVAGLSQVNEPPAIGGFEGYTAPTITFLDTGNYIHVVFTNSDDWAGEVGGAMTFRICPIGFKAGQNFYEGPFVFADSIDGAATPPTSPQDVAAGITITAGVKYAVAMRVVGADGRYSKEAFFLGVAT